MQKELVDKKLFIRTVTYHLVGKVEKVEDGFITLSGASWIADSGRFSQAISDGTLTPTVYGASLSVLAGGVRGTSRPYRPGAARAASR